MLGDANALLGRLQRGRGDAVREVLAMPREAASDVLCELLCTLEGEGTALVAQVHGYAELVLAVQPDLHRWFDWISGLAVAGDDDDVLFPFNLLGELAVRGHAGCDSFLREYVVDGANWSAALVQFLRDGLRLQRATWERLLPRIDDDNLQVHVDPGDAVWREFAADDARVARCLAAAVERRRRRDESRAWSPDNYAQARSSQARWQVLESLVRTDAAAAQPLLVDGLWDANDPYRARCVVHCRLEWPGVRERLEVLARDERSSAGYLAREKLAGR